MIIGIDISSTAYGTGVSNYTLNLVRYLLKNDTQNTYKLFFSSLRLPLPQEIKELKESPRLKIYHYRIPPTLLAVLWNKLHILPIEFFVGKCDVFHCSDWTQAPSIQAKTITTIHDLTPFLYPQWLDSKIVVAHSQKMFWAIKECQHFICVSKNTQNDLLKIFPNIKPSQCSVIYEAAEDKYSQFLKLPLSEQKSKKNKIWQQYGLKKYILSQGTREPRKNLARLIRAFKLYHQKHPNSPVELAITGKYGWGNDILHLKTPYIKILGYIPEKDMVALHASALFLAYPSLYEGFGLPLVKSMALGVPILTSNNSSLSEIAESSGILVNPNSVKSIYQGLDKLISNNNLRKQLSQKSLTQSKKFSWTLTAEQTLNIYLKFKN